jgi:alpha/beta superfamily hydrolase
MGGDRFHPVVGAVFEAAAGVGWAACRFDFSSSRAEAGVGQATDALDLLPAVPVTVVGWTATGS